MSSAPPALLRRLCRDVGFDSNHTRFLPARDPEAWRVFADGLLDKGDVRGRLIHARLDAEMAPGRRPAYEQLRRELAAAHRETWLANLPEGVGAILRDGFVVGWWTYDEPHFTRWLEAWPAFQAHPDGALCSSWRHEGDLADETLQQLTQGSELAGLRRLHLWENELASAQTRGAPSHYQELLDPLPEGVTISSRLRSDVDLWHVFTAKRKTLRDTLTQAQKEIRQDGMIWVSWPKKASGLPSEITEDTIRELALPMGLVDVKVCAVDATWSGLKLVIRKELRKPG